MATLAPSAARRLAIAAPMPRDAPVTSAILPSRFFDMGVLPGCLECAEQWGYAARKLPSRIAHSVQVLPNDRLQALPTGYDRRSFWPGKWPRLVHLEVGRASCR